MRAIDLNLSNPGLAEKAAELGWSETLAAAVFPAGKTPAKAGEIVCAESGDTEALRRAAANPRVALLNPLLVKDFHKDDGLVRAVAEAGKAFEIPVRPLLEKNFVYRAKLMAQLRVFLAKCLKLGAAFVFTSRAQSEFDLKSPQETIALIQALGLSRQQAQYSITKAPEKISEAVEWRK